MTTLPVVWKKWNEPQDMEVKTHRLRIKITLHPQWTHISLLS